MRSLCNRIVRRQERLPTHAAVQGQMRIGLPSVLQIEANVVLAHVPWRDIVLRECRWPAQHQIAERHTRILCVEVNEPGADVPAERLNWVWMWLSPNPSWCLPF